MSVHLKIWGSTGLSAGCIQHFRTRPCGIRGPYILRGPKYVVSSPTPTMFSFGGVEQKELLFGYHDMFCFNGRGGGGGKASEDDLAPGCQGAYPLCALACLVVSESKEQSVPTPGEGMGVGERT